MGCWVNFKKRRKVKMGHLSTIVQRITQRREANILQYLLEVGILPNIETCLRYKNKVQLFCRSYSFIQFLIRFFII